MERKRLGEILLTLGHVNETKLQRALNFQRTIKGKLGHILVCLKYCTDEHIQEALKVQSGEKRTGIETARWSG